MDKISTCRRDALARLLSHRFGGNQADLARSISRSPSTVWRLLSHGDHSKPIGERLARDIESKLGLPPYWMDGVAQPLHPAVANQDVHVAQATTPAAIPLYSEADAAARALRGRGGVKEVGAMFVSTSAGGGAWGFVVASDAMSPLITPGDRVLIDPSVRPVPGDVVLALLNENQALLRRIRSQSSQLVDYDLVPNNSDYQIVKSGKSVRLIGTMIEHHRIRPAR